MFRLVNKCKNKKGFTLIELIVVLAVLGIIAAIAVPRYLGVQEEAKKDADEQTIEMVKSALELCIASEDAINVPDVEKTIGTISSTGFTLNNDTSTNLKGINDTLLGKYLDKTNAKLNSTANVDIKIDESGNITSTTYTYEE